MSADERERWVFDKKTLKRIRKEMAPYLRATRQRDIVGLNFATCEAVADLLEDMANEIERLRK